MGGVHCQSLAHGRASEEPSRAMVLLLISGLLIISPLACLIMEYFHHVKMFQSIFLAFTLTAISAFPNVCYSGEASNNVVKMFELTLYFLHGFYYGNNI